ncbi:unnamed protein product, partial [Allacma fusca]
WAGASVEDAGWSSLRMGKGFVASVNGGPLQEPTTSVS